MDRKSDNLGDTSDTEPQNLVSGGGLQRADTKHANAVVVAAAAQTAREAYEQWVPRLQAALEAWQGTLPPEAEATWTRGGVYVRESSARSLRGEAPDTQIRNALAIAERKYIYVPSDGLFFDVESGTDIGPRRAFQRLFERCLSGGFRAVVVYMHERLFRNVEQAKKVSRDFRKNGVELLYSGMFEGDQRNPAAWQLETMHQTMGEYHARNTSWYVGNHLEMLSRDGRPIGQTPETFRATSWAPSVLGHRGSPLSWETVEPLGKILVEGKDRYLAGATFPELARWTATTELKGVTPAGRRMTAGWWRYQFRNPRHAGHQMPSSYKGYKPGVESPKRDKRTRTSELVRCDLPALWDLDTYYKLLDTAADRWKGPKARRTYQKYLLSGIAVDAECGHLMYVGLSQRASERFWLHCNQNGDGHRRPRRRADVAEKELDQLLAGLDFEDATLHRQIAGRTARSCLGRGARARVISAEPPRSVRCDRHSRPWLRQG